MAEIRYAVMALYAIVFYSLLQLSVAPDGGNHILPQSGDLQMEDIQMEVGELIQKSNLRRLRATGRDAMGMRSGDKTQGSPPDIALRTTLDADDSARDAKAGRKLRTDHSAEGEYSKTRTQRDSTTGIQSSGDARSNRGKTVTGNQTKYAGDSSTSISCASGFKNNCQRTRSQVNKTRSKHEQRIGDGNVRRELVDEKALLASTGLRRKMNALKSGMLARRSDPLSRTVQARNNSKEIIRNHGNSFYKEMRDGSHESEQKVSELELFKDGIFWSRDVETLLPNWTSEADVTAWLNDVRSQRIVRLLPGCGRESNRLAVLENGVMVCCRYRQNVDQIQGDILSFHLSRLIGIGNLPLGVLMKIEPDSDQWKAVKKNITAAGWKENRIIVATKWIPDLEPAFVPLELKSLNGTIRRTPLDKVSRISRSPDRLVELIQWSDLAIFDYVTANLDRVVNTLVNLQWNRHMLMQPVHNLEMSKTDRGLLFLDNESGLRHGYRMLDQFGHYHDQILKSFCVFREQTVQRLKILSEHVNFWELFMLKVDSEEPLLQNLPSYPPKFRDVLKNRMKNVVHHAENCKRNSLK
ncbi:four-jointed box protein 1-like [Lytechinus pictus]|uniref:four-jointed box protein 1-like n=1 Tax=Lytechinus pictus TaxID=7653 RepID=UPI0030B9B805